MVQDFAVITASIVLPSLIGATLRFWLNQQPPAGPERMEDDSRTAQPRLKDFRGLTAEEDPTLL